MLPTLLSRLARRRSSPSCVKICRARSEAAKARSYSPRRISGWMELVSVRAASSEVIVGGEQSVGLGTQRERDVFLAAKFAGDQDSGLGKTQGGAGIRTNLVN